MWNCGLVLRLRSLLSTLMLYQRSDAKTSAFFSRYGALFIFELSQPAVLRVMRRIRLHTLNTPPRAYLVPCQSRASCQLPMVFKPTTSVDVASFAHQLHRNHSTMFETANVCKLHPTRLPPRSSCNKEGERYHARQGSAPGNILFVVNHRQSLFFRLMTARLHCDWLLCPCSNCLKEL